MLGRPVPITGRCNSRVRNRAASGFVALHVGCAHRGLICDRLVDEQPSAWRACEQSCGYLFKALARGSGFIDLPDRVEHGGQIVKRGHEIGMVSKLIFLDRASAL